MFVVLTACSAYTPHTHSYLCLWFSVAALAHVDTVTNYQVSLYVLLFNVHPWIYVPLWWAKRNKLFVLVLNHKHFYELNIQLLTKTWVAYFEFWPILHADRKTFHLCCAVFQSTVCHHDDMTVDFCIFVNEGLRNLAQVFCQTLWFKGHLLLHFSNKAYILNGTVLWFPTWTLNGTQASCSVRASCESGDNGVHAV